MSLSFLTSMWSAGKAEFSRRAKSPWSHKTFFCASFLHGGASRAVPAWLVVALRAGNPVLSSIEKRLSL